MPVPRRKLALATTAAAMALAASPLVASSAAQFEQCDGPDANFYYACSNFNLGTNTLELTTFANYNQYVAHLAEWGPSHQFSFFDEAENTHYLNNSFSASCSNLLVTHMMDWGSGVETLQQSPC